MKILVVSQYFWPENFRINDLCAELVKRGHEVTVLTGKPNYPVGKVFPEYQANPGAYLHYQGCKLVRVPMIARGQGALRLMLNYSAFVVSASIFGSFRLRKNHFDVTFVYEPSPVTVCLPAIFIKKIKKTPVVFWVQDLWPETLEAIGVVKSPKILALIGQLVRFIYNRCDLILGQSRAFYPGIAKYCENVAKIRYFPNWSENVFSVQKTEPIGEIAADKNVFKVLFAGNVGEAQDFPAILRSAQLLKKQGAKTRFYIVGDGRMLDWLKNEIIKGGLEDYVTLLGRHPLESMPSFYASADALLATLKDSPVFSMTIPCKVQSYMTAGKPILTMISGEGSRVVSEAECGYVADSGDFDLLAENIISMSQLPPDSLKVLGDNAKIYAKKEFDRAKLIDQLENWFFELTS
ncbi:glycosyltransferase family 4 protein [Desulfuromonas sp. AOP6]|uniref:glycosyltransferase family 4 protein n=1 Tax=Desulfuromonas sp. AOP6 TaxID=1566351 RepID=UPI001270B16A|nr:glycosyltransferase family 4 protein [Desulfuromonas sp. AOP6]BCA80077.1 glycosyltransferase WbuB [Desulfuromonas sp. AOP6]